MDKFIISAVELRTFIEAHYDATKFNLFYDKEEEKLFIAPDKEFPTILCLPLRSKGEEIT